MTKTFHGFKWLAGDVNYLDYGGTWYRYAGKSRFHIIELDPVERTVVFRGHKYYMELSEVDLDLIDPTDALTSCGWKWTSEGIVDDHSNEIIAELGSKDFPLLLAEACHGYGAKARLSSGFTGNYRQMFKEFSAISSHLIEDEDAHEAILDSPGNAIGTPRRDMMLGKLFNRR